MKFKAVRVIDAKEAQQYLDEGAEEIPMRWVETDKNEKLRAPTNPLPPKMKSRLVARGDLQVDYGRTDSPTVEDEGVYILPAPSPPFDRFKV